MRISVRCRSERAGAEEMPCGLRLGRCSLAIDAVLERWTEAGCHYYEVSVEDGRRFVLRRQERSSLWELEAVYPARRPRVAIFSRERRR